MSLDKRYEEILEAEFSAEGAVLHGQRRPPVGHAVAIEAPVAAAGGFAAQATPEVHADAAAGREGPRGLARYRNATVVGAGGVACAMVGALIGGIGGLGGPGVLGAQGGLAGLGASPAAAQSLTSPASPGTLRAASHQGVDSSAAARGSAAVAIASLSSLSGSLTQGIPPLNGLAAGTDAPAPKSGTGVLTGQPSGGSSGTGSGADVTASAGNPVSVSIPVSPAPSPSVVNSPLPSVTAGITPLAGDISESLVPVVPSQSATSSAVSAVVPSTTDALSHLTSSAISTAATTTTVTVPVPALPAPAPPAPALPLQAPPVQVSTPPVQVSTPPVQVSTPPVQVSAVSAGVSTSGSGSGLTLNLP